ncbi:HD domain-containing protein [Methanofervidicoccus sp. A16]|uniref:HD domain-containing protein n=1 Tax=Methanofervidicoccus sp. A16 TaxID=2607662 RepID=UPI00118ADDE9|nr:HD domain-containing protein [Methanofervidicoccus sp. A16]AXI24744.1 HD domain-containing protein [Methanofervidicoccus sp. A16]
MSGDKIIRDPIYYDIHIRDSEISIIDTPEFQRLRNIKQTGLTYMVYPSATHTRFEHSIGAMHIAGEVSKGLEGVDCNLIRIAALLHDIGHPPFSHSLEIRGYNHEYYTRKIVKKMEIENYSPKEVIDVLQYKGPEGSLIGGDIDIDRIDYLLRDSYHTGVAYGSIDYNRLIRCIVLFEDNKPKLGILEKGVVAGESLLIARYQMYSSVYMHPTSRISETMLKNAVIHGIEEGLFDVKDLSRMDDIDLISTLRNSEGEGNKLIKMLDRRKLFKNVLTVKYSELSPYEKWILINLREEEIRYIEEELSEKFGTTVFLDIPPYPKISEHRITVLAGERRYRLDEISPLAKNLKWAYMKSWDVRLYGPPDRYKELREKIDSTQLKEILLQFRDRYMESPILDILRKEDRIRGRGKLLSIVKGRGLSESEILNELQKLIFSGLIREEVVKVRGIYRYDYSALEG